MYISVPHTYKINIDHHVTDTSCLYLCNNIFVRPKINISNPLKPNQKKVQQKNI